MQIREFRVFEGRNIYSHHPVIKMTLDLERFALVTSAQLNNFATRLPELLPGLSSHYCSRGRPGGFIERLHEGTYLGHVIEHVALELQTLLGLEVIYGKTVGAAEPGVYDVVYAYICRETGIACGKLAVNLVGTLAEDRCFDLADELKQLQVILRENQLGPSTAAIVEACRRRDIPVLRMNCHSLLQLGHGCRQRQIEATISDRTAGIGIDVASNKQLTKELLAENGLPVPLGSVVDNEGEMLEVTRRIGYPVVIKPLNSNQGKGVSIGLQNEAEVLRAMQTAQFYSQQVIVEKYITGRHYRVLVINGQVEAAAERLPAQVVGDGRHCIRELIEQVNCDPARGEGHEKELSKIRVDAVTLANLARQGLDLYATPPRGQTVILRENANLSTGGTAIDVTDIIHSEFRDMAVRAAEVVGLDIAGVDLVCQDVANIPGGNDWAIIEVNAAPGLRMHLYPVRGQSRPVGEAIVEYLFPSATPARIPIVAVTGTNGKTTVTRLTSHLLALAGQKVGMTSTDGIYLDGKLIVKGDASGPKSARTVLRDRKITAAVLETARGGIIKGGLGYDRADVAIVTNISEDHLGQDGLESLDDLFHVKSLVVEAVSEQGCVVLNADDIYGVKMAGRARRRVIYFSSNTENMVIRRHLGVGGEAVFIKKGYVVLAQGDRTTRLAAVGSLPLCFGGRARHNLQNILAAVAGAWGLGLSLAVIRAGITTFGANLRQHNPGRLNLYEFGDIRVILDYGHNVAGFRSILEFARELKPQRLIGVIGVPGDRRNKTIIRAGEVAGAGFDRIFIKEDSDLRERQPGEVAALLKQGAQAAGMKSSVISLVSSEVMAVAKALRQAKPGDLVVIFYEKIEPVRVLVERLASRANRRSLGKETIAAAE